VFPGSLRHKEEFRFCHIDVDVYQSAKDIVTWLWPRLAIGGIIVFDDYGFPYSQGITTLVDES
jgi:O-methyltransferase